MGTTERIHSDFETIERPNQTYRISTRVEYRVGMNDYRCKADLWKQYGGRCRDPKRNRLNRTTRITSDKIEIDELLEECIEACKEKLDEVEDAKDVSVSVDITDE